MTWDVPGYSVVRVLSEGPMGRVVQATRDGFGDQVAILDRADVIPDEAALLTALRDPHVVRIHHYVEARQALVMEFVDGTSLDRLLQDSGPMPPETALRVLRECLLGLAAAHRIGIVHRGLTPANILLAGGVCKLTGFGVALPGAPGYTAPERWNGELTPAGDLYSAAAVFYHCLTGAAPGDRVLLPEWMPPAVRALAARGTALYPAARPKDAEVFGALVDAVMRGEWAPPGAPATFAVPEPGPSVPEPRPALLKPMAAVIAVGVVCGAGAFGLGTVFGGDEEPAKAAQRSKPAPAAKAKTKAKRSVPPGTGVSRGRMRFTINPTARVVGSAAKAASAGNRRRIDVALVVAPAVVRPGNTVTVRMAEKRTDPSGCPPVVKRTWGWSVGDGKSGALWLYSRTAGVLPTRVSEQRIEAGVQKAAAKTAMKGCVRITVLRSVFRFTVPSDGSMKPGTYLLSPSNPPRVARIYGVRAGGDVELPLSEARATNEGRLPALTVR
ncbi:protein kinase domain-containing protein [Actinomadura roseirufa]|uniref:protein kinase domain-containing protein n=1 Tax=Actinomadura roseirufa TaxID=2094049 RepID=UPI0010413411|nr:serine/threonine-protein kinase [Actinomadura roseirufa]